MFVSLQQFQEIQRDFLPGFNCKFLCQCPSIITFFCNTILKNENKPIIFFNQHHLICSHLAVVCISATVSIKTMQVLLDPY